MPSATMLQDIRPEHLLNDTMSPLRLTIGLRMVRARKLQSRAKYLHQRAPE